MHSKSFSRSFPIHCSGFLLNCLWLRWSGLLLRRVIGFECRLAHSKVKSSKGTLCGSSSVGPQFSDRQVPHGRSGSAVVPLSRSGSAMCCRPRRRPGAGRFCERPHGCCGAVRRSGPRLSGNGRRPPTRIRRQSFPLPPSLVSSSARPMSSRASSVCSAWFMCSRAPAPPAGWRVLWSSWRKGSRPLPALPGIPRRFRTLAFLAVPGWLRVRSPGSCLLRRRYPELGRRPQ